MNRHPFIATLACVALLGAGCTGDSDKDSASGRGPSGSPGPTTPAVDYTVWDAGRSEPIADPLYPKRGTAALDVLHYGLELAWDPAKKILTGAATLRIRATADANQFSLDFKPYQLDAVTVDGVTVTAEVADEKLTVSLPVVKDRRMTLVVRYHGKPTTTPMPSHRADVEPLGLTITKDGGLWTMQEPFGAFTWYPANDQPSDKALYDLAVTVPAGWSAIASGSPAGQEGTTFRYTSQAPVATYLTTLAVGKYSKASAEGPHGIPLTYWYRPGTDKKLLPLLRKSPTYLSWLEKKFGPYPFDTGGIVVVDSESGMETQQMITMGGKVDWAQRDKNSFDLDLLHEYSHQWFGDSVGPTNWKDLWLNEGWATYAQFLYQQDRDSISDADLTAYLREADGQRRKELGPPGNPAAANFAEGNVYRCPAAMLDEIRHLLGDKKFFAMATAWAQESKNSTQDRASFIAFVNRNTGRDFTKLINNWLDSKTTPKSTVK